MGIDNSLSFLCMSHDDASGIISYDKDIDSIDITWDRVGFESNFEIVNEALEKMAKGLKGKFVKNPMWSPALGKSVISAHPLGGCPMGESGRTAVVNHAGQIFEGEPLRIISSLVCKSKPYLSITPQNKKPNRSLFSLTHSPVPM